MLIPNNGTNPKNWSKNGPKAGSYFDTNMYGDILLRSYLGAWIALSKIYY